MEGGGREDNNEHDALAFMTTHQSFLIPTSQAPKKVTKKPAKKAAPKANPLFVAEPRSFRVGGAIRVSSAWHRKKEREGVWGGWRRVTESCLSCGLLMYCGLFGI
jgi:hypothetical protein